MTYTYAYKIEHNVVLLFWINCDVLEQARKKKNKRFCFAFTYSS